MQRRLTVIAIFWKRRLGSPSCWHYRILRRFLHRRFSRVGCSVDNSRGNELSCINGCKLAAACLPVLQCLQGRRCFRLTVFVLLQLYFKQTSLLDQVCRSSFYCLAEMYTGRVARCPLRESRWVCAARSIKVRKDVTHGRTDSWLLFTLFTRRGQRNGRQHIEKNIVKIDFYGQRCVYNSDGTHPLNDQLFFECWLVIIRIFHADQDGGTSGQRSWFSVVVRR